MGILNALVFRQLPAADPERLVAVRPGAFGAGEDRMPIDTFERLEASSRTISGMFAWWGDYPLVNMEANGVAFPGLYGEVSARYFETLGARPLIGRVLSPQDAGRDVAVLDYRCWNRHFGRNPAVIGKPIRVGHRLLTVIGVTPRQFTGMEADVAPDVTAPFDASGHIRVAVVGRLADEANLAAAQAEMESLWPSLADGEWRQRRVRVESVATGVSYGRRRKVGPLLSIVALVGTLLLLACANLANTMLPVCDSRSGSRCALKPPEPLALG